MSSSAHSRKKVSYIYHDDIGNYNYGTSHPMIPHRIRMTSNLVFHYGLCRKMTLYKTTRATANDMMKYHTPDYIRFLRDVCPENEREEKFQKNMEKFHVGNPDCPVFHGLYEFCQLSAGGSVGGAVLLNKQDTEIAINWSGGLHHAKKGRASGFCYVNDIVLSIQELLKYHQRVLYIDIDIHHGDGVEEAFYTTDRVMTLSFHKYGLYEDNGLMRAYFPGTGDITDIGFGNGKYYSLNCPLRDGIDDDSFESIFNSIVGKVLEKYQPNALVFQCGADSLANDPIGKFFNLSIKGHGKCVEFLKKYNRPLLLLGGGGYNLPNVARCWTYETAMAIGTDISDKIPPCEYWTDYAPDFKLHISPSSMSNQNTREYLEKNEILLFENLRMLPCSPSVEMKDISDDGISIFERESESRWNLLPETSRPSILANRNTIHQDNELSDSEDEGEGRRNEFSYKKVKRMNVGGDRSTLKEVPISALSREINTKAKGRVSAASVSSPLSTVVTINIETKFILEDGTFCVEENGDQTKRDPLKVTNTVPVSSPVAIKVPPTLDVTETSLPTAVTPMEITITTGKMAKKLSVSFSDPVTSTSEPIISDNNVNSILPTRIIPEEK